MSYQEILIPKTPEKISAKRNQPPKIFLDAKISSFSMLGATILSQFEN
jgi:hypothetical protein